MEEVHQLERVGSVLRILSSENEREAEELEDWGTRDEGIRFMITPKRRNTKSQGRSIPCNGWNKGHDRHYRNKTHGGYTRLELIFRLQEGTRMEGGEWLDVMLAVSCKYLAAGFGKAARTHFSTRRPKRIFDLCEHCMIGNKCKTRFLLNMWIMLLFRISRGAYSLRMSL